MSITSANVRNLNDSRAQALQALQSVSERLGNILGDTELLGPGDGTRRNESDELINEDGLPIIDITEPVDELDTPSLSAATEEDEVTEDYPAPISKLSPEALAISRQHRDKILDLLEQEEEREALKTHEENQLELKRKREAARIEMQRRMLNQGLELEKRRKSKELEMKMAQALISGPSETEPMKNKASVQHPDGKTKKVVTFADQPSASCEVFTKPKGNAINWAPSRKDRLASARTQPMKTEVVERTSSLPSSNPVYTRQELTKQDHTDSAGDSDDESDTEVASDTPVLEFEDEDVVLMAQHHRELAMEYHRRREALASSAGAQSLDDDDLPRSQDPDAANWDTEEVPLDATLAHPPPKPRISKFKASLVNQRDHQTLAPVTQTNRPPSSSRDSTNPRSATLGTSVLPADALSKSIKLGKLVNGQLIAGPQDEEDIDREEQEEEEIRKLLLKSMEEYSGIAAQIMGPAAKVPIVSIDG